MPKHECGASTSAAEEARLGVLTGNLKGGRAGMCSVFPAARDLLMHAVCAMCGWAHCAAGPTERLGRSQHVGTSHTVVTSSQISSKACLTCMWPHRASRCSHWRGWTESLPLRSDTLQSVLTVTPIHLILGPSGADGGFAVVRCTRVPTLHNSLVDSEQAQTMRTLSVIALSVR